MTWKEEFYRLYLSPESDSNIKALEMKRKNLPEKLFRYRPLGAEIQEKKESQLEHLLREISSGQIYASPVTRLNDPFEGYSLLEKGNALKSFLASKRLKTNYENQFKNRLTACEFREIFDSDDWYEKLLHYVSEKTNSSFHELKEAINGAISSVIEEDFVTRENELRRQVMRIACFSEKKF